MFQPVNIFHLSENLPVILSFFFLFLFFISTHPKNKMASLQLVCRLTARDHIATTAKVESKSKPWQPNYLDLVAVYTNTVYAAIVTLDNLHTAIVKIRYK